MFSTSSSRLRVGAALTSTLFFWASAFPAIRASLKYFDPGHLALLRMLAASIVAITYLLLRRRPLASRNDWPAIGLMGLLGHAIYHVALNAGELSVTAGSAAFLINTAPIFTVILAVIFLHERLKPVGWLGVAVSFVGSSIIAMGESGGLSFSPAALLILLAAFSASCYLIIQKRLLARYNALDLSAFTILAATTWLLVFSPNLLRVVMQAPWTATASVIYLGVFATGIGYTTWAFVLAHMAASRAISFLYVISPLVLLLSWLWLREVPQPQAVLGGLVTLVGVILVNSRGKTQEPVEQPATS
jgi:drug/metabolite transporter (DMT)-like permease